MKQEAIGSNGVRRPRIIPTKGADHRTWLTKRPCGGRRCTIWRTANGDIPRAGKHVYEGIVLGHVTAGHNRNLDEASVLMYDRRHNSDKTYRGNSASRCDAKSRSRNAVPNFFEHDRGFGSTLLGGGGIKPVAASRLPSTRNYQHSHLGRAIDPDHGRRRRTWPAVLLYCKHLQARMRTALYCKQLPLPKCLMRPKFIFEEIIMK